MKEKPILASQFDPLQTVAAAIGVSRETVRSAVERGEIDSARLASGTSIVSIESAKKWAENRPKLGRPKKAE